MDKNLRTLEKHLGRFSVLDTLPEQLPVPVEWQPLIGLTDHAKAKYVTSLWAKDYSEELRVLLGVFQKRLRTVHLIELAGQPALLYVFKNPKGEYLSYVGHAPRSAQQLPPNAEALP